MNRVSILLSAILLATLLVTWNTRGPGLVSASPQERGSLDQQKDKMRRRLQAEPTAPAARVALPSDHQRSQESFRRSPGFHRETVSLSIRLEIDGIATSTGVVAVSGIGSEIRVVEYRSGTSTTANSVKLAGPTRTEDITLVVATGPLADALWTWYADCQKKKMLTKRNMSIVFVNNTGQEVVRYNIAQGWPCRWRGFESVRPGQVDLTEEITITGEGLTRP